MIQGLSSYLGRFRHVWIKVEAVVAGIMYLEWAVWLGIFAISVASSAHADSTADWLVAKATADGESPFQDLRVLADRYGVPFVSPAGSEVSGEWIHPRTPAALLLLQPVIALSPSTLHDIVIAVSLVLLAPIVYVQWPVLARMRRPHAVFLAAVLLLSGPIIRTLQFGAWSVFYAGLLAVFWHQGRRSSDVVSGFSLGLLIALRLFPGLLIVPLLALRRWKLAAWAVVTAVGLNLVGALAMSLSPRTVVEGLGAAEGTWSSIGGNGSLLRPLILLAPDVDSAIVVAILTLTVSAYLWTLAHRGLDFDRLIALGVVSMLLISPLSWEHYDAMLFPAVALLVGSKEHLLRFAGWSWILAMTVGFLARQPWEHARLLPAGLSSFLGRLLLLMVLVVGFEMSLRGRGVGTSAVDTVEGEAIFESGIARPSVVHE